MGLISNLCSEMEIAPWALAQIVGLPYEQVKRWEVGGVPLQFQGDFRILEELLVLLRRRAAAPTRTAVRVRLAELGGRSALDALTQHGPMKVLERLTHASVPEISGA